MKQFFLAVSVSAVAIVNVHAQAKPKPKLKVVNPAGVVQPSTGVLRSSLDSLSYALGLNIANNLKQQRMDTVADAPMQRGFKEVFKKQTQTLSSKRANTFK